MKRKLLALLTALLLLATMVTPAFADLILEPNNSFFETHRNQCVHYDRSYIVNGENGYVTVKTAPNASKEIMNAVNGTLFSVSFVWTDRDGTQWGIGHPAGAFESEGWVPLSALAQIYDYRDFAEDYGSEFRDYDGSGDELEQAYVYSYPGGTVSELIMENKQYAPFAETFRNLYTDENGLRWTFVGYYMGRRDGWVCIDDPMNENLGTDTLLTVDQVRGGNELVPPVVEVPVTGTFPLWVIPVVLVIAVAVVTALIVRRRRR